jgi:hypothetical protein
VAVISITDEQSNRSAGSLARLQRLAWLMDKSIRLPGGFRIGADGIIGLVPVVGDFATACVSSYIVAEAARMKVPKSVLLRMGLNVLVDFVVGSVPIAGDLFDFAFKANLRNIALLESYLNRPSPTRTRSRWLVAAAILLLVLAAVAAVTAVIKLTQFLWTTFAV